MFDEDHPLHSEDVRQAAGSPAVDVVQSPPGIDPLNPTLNMNYIITYNHGPPYNPWWPLVSGFNPNHYPYPQQSYYGGMNPWHSSYAQVFNYYYSPFMAPQPVPMWRPPPPAGRGHVQPTYNQHQPAIKPIQGTSVQIENQDTTPCVGRMKSGNVQDEMGAGATLPPNIYDNTVFPSLTSKKKYRQPPLNPHFGAPFNQYEGPHSFKGVKKPKDIPKSTQQGSNNLEKVEEERNENKTVDFPKQKVIESKLENTFEKKCQANEKDNTDHTAAKKIVDSPPRTTYQATCYQEESPWMIARSSWALFNMVPSVPLSFGVHHQELYRYILRYVPSRKRLEDQGYPLVSCENPGETIIIWKKEFHSPIDIFKSNNNEKVKSTDKFCARCGKTILMRNGKSIYKEKCVYHWGKVESTEDFKVLLTCCNLPPNSNGCAKAKSHVWSGFHFGENAVLKGFVRTAFSATNGPGLKVYGLDCEMCFTTEGLELVKVALVDLAGNPVYYSLVLPENEVIDYNTRFSGVSEKDFTNFRAKDFKKVQEEVLKLIETDTIIIGHGLENDLRALKIIHQLVVDTSIIYPHKHGIPFKRPLKELAKEILKRQIQVAGHNPVEDANVCVDLVLHKLKEDFSIGIIA